MMRSARMLRAELPVHKNSRLYGRSAMGSKGFCHAGSRFRAQRSKLFAGLHGRRDTLALDGAVVLPLEEWLRRLREQDQLRDVGRAGAPLKFLKDEVAYARTARPDFNDPGAQQSSGSEALQSAGANDPRALTGDDKFRLRGDKIGGR